MGIRIRPPGVVMIVIGVAGALFLVFYRQEWTWVQMGVMGAVVAVGVIRSLKGGG